MSLSNFDLEKLANELKINLVCVLSKNELIHAPIRSGGYIINLQSSDQGNGTHWVAIILYNVINSTSAPAGQSPRRKKQLRAIYVDNYGVLPPIEIEDFCHKATQSKIAYNTRQIQKINTSECGWYCLSLIYSLQYHRTSNDMIEDFHKWLSMFSSDLTLDLPILKKTFEPYNINFYTKTVTLN
jgi:hypothetical protein